MPKETGIKFKKIADKLFEGNLAALSRALGMNPGGFSKYTSGETMPGGRILKRLSLLGVNLNWFLADIPPMLSIQMNENPELMAIEDQGLEEIFTRIKWVRINYKKTISEMAGICSVSSETQATIEKGEKPPWPEYVTRLLNEFTDVIPEWLREGTGDPLFSQKSYRLHSALVSRVAEPDYLENINEDDLSEAERRILDAVRQFSDFLKTRSFHPYVKLVLLEQLIESIDQAIEQPGRDPGDS